MISFTKNNVYKDGLYLGKISDYSFFPAPGAMLSGFDMETITKELTRRAYYEA
jgi:hypothetical protein